MMKTYKTVSGDTWDNISFKCYGSESYVNELFNANPNLIKYIIFSGNIDINIPDVDLKINEELPPWLRPDTVQAIENTDLLDIVNNYLASV